MFEYMRYIIDLPFLEDDNVELSEFNEIVNEEIYNAAPLNNIIKNNILISTGGLSFYNKFRSYSDSDLPLIVSDDSQINEILYEAISVLLGKLSWDADYVYQLSISEDKWYEWDMSQYGVGRYNIKLEIIDFRGKYVHMFGSGPNTHIYNLVTIDEQVISDNESTMAFIFAKLINTIEVYLEAVEEKYGDRFEIDLESDNEDIDFLYGEDECF